MLPPLRSTVFDGIIDPIHALNNAAGAVHTAGNKQKAPNGSRQVLCDIMILYLYHMLGVKIYEKI